LTDDQVQKLTVGDRIKLGALTGTIVQAGALFVAIQWDKKDLPELYTRAAMGHRGFFATAEEATQVTVPVHPFSGSPSAHDPVRVAP